MIMKIYKNLQDIDKIVSRDKFIALSVYISKKENSQITNLSSLFKN